MQRWSWVWLVCCALVATLSLATASHKPYSDGSGSGLNLPLFPTETVVGFERSNVFVRESKRAVELCAVVFEPQTGPISENFTVTILTADGFAKSGVDYESVSQVLGPFNDTTRRLCVDVPLIDDMICESNPFPEDFSAVMLTGNSNVTVTPRRIGIAIDDQKEPECINVCVGFEETSYVVVEEIGYFLACINIECPQHLLREVTVALTTASSTAEAGKDFVELASVNIGPFTAYGMRKCAAIQIIDDGDCEQSERFFLRLDSTDPLVSFTTNNVPVVIDGTTEYDDCASVRAGFTLPYHVVKEGDGEVSVCVGAFEPEKFGANFTLMANTKDGTLDAGTDYVTLEDLVVGPLNRTVRQKCFDVELINDNVCGNDPGRFFTIELSTYAALVDVNPFSTRVYVYDAVECTPVYVGLILTTFNVQENELMMTLCATVSRPPVLEREVEVFVNTADYTAEEGEDYIGVTDEQLSFSEDARTACFNVTILNDGVCEDFEYFTVSLSATAQRVIPSPPTGYIIIRDPPLCTAVEVGLEQRSYSTFEGAGSVEVCVGVQSDGLAMPDPFNLLVSTQDGSATAPSDYVPLTDMMIGPIDADTPEVCFQVTIVQDGVCEGSVDGEGVPSPEVFTVVVRTEDGSDIEVRGSNRVATITIEDSAECIPVVMGFEESSYVVRESEGAVELIVDVTSPDVLRRQVSLTIETVSGSAVAGADYDAISQSLGPFSNEDRTLSVLLAISDDGVCDSSPAETLQVRLNTSDPNVTLAPAITTVTILDSPQCTPGTVTFEQSTFISSEETGWAVVCASFTGSPSTAPFSLALSTFDDTANAGSDYVSVSMDLEFGPDSPTRCELILLVQDRECESTMTESFGVRLMSRGSGFTAVQDEASVVIYDASDCITVSVQFEEVVYSLPESRGRVMVCAEISSPAVAEREFFLNITSSDRDAVAGVDYSLPQDTLLGPFSLSHPRHCLVVSVIDDSLCEEPEESFILSLSTSDEFINIPRDSVTVYIEDSMEIECVQVSCGFESTDSIVQETVGSVEVCVGVPSSQVLQFQFILTITTVDGSATGGLDYIPIDQELTFGPGQQRKCVFVTILNDQECEDDPNEMFTVVARGDDPRCILQPSTLSITIDDAGRFAPLTDPDCFPLEIYFIDNTPQVTLESIEIVFNTRGRSLPQTITCDLINSRGSIVQTSNCTDGRTVFAGIARKGFYTVKATVVTGRETSSTQTRVRYDPSDTACSVHLINRGLTFASGGMASGEFTGVGPVDSFTCTLNNDVLTEQCTSPVELSGLDEYTPYVLKVIPVGLTCDPIKKLRENFNYFEPYSTTG